VLKAPRNATLLKAEFFKLTQLRDNRETGFNLELMFGKNYSLRSKSVFWYKNKNRRAKKLRVVV
jgi:hypothetical protein